MLPTRGSRLFILLIFLDVEKQEKALKCKKRRENGKFTEFFLKKQEIYHLLPPFLAFLGIFSVLHSFLRPRNYLKKSRLPFDCQSLTITVQELFKMLMG